MVIHYQVLLCLDTYNTDAIAKQAIRYVSLFYDVLSYKSAAGLPGLFKIWCLQRFGDFSY